MDCRDEYDKSVADIIALEKYLVKVNPVEAWQNCCLMLFDDRRCSLGNNSKVTLRKRGLFFFVLQFCIDSFRCIDICFFFVVCVCFYIMISNTLLQTNIAIENSPCFLVNTIKMVDFPWLC